MPPTACRGPSRDATRRVGLGGGPAGRRSGGGLGTNPRSRISVLRAGHLVVVGRRPHWAGRPARQLRRVRRLCRRKQGRSRAFRGFSWPRSCRRRCSQRNGPACTPSAFGVSAGPSWRLQMTPAWRRHLMVALVVGACVACSEETPQAQCPSATPGQTPPSECKDFGEDEGPLDNE